VTPSTSRLILGLRVDATTYDEAVQKVLDWARAGESRVVVAANVHMVMEARDRRSFQRQVNASDLTTADGMPLVWALRRLGVPHATRVYGPDLTVALMAAAAREAIPVGFLGGSPRTLERLVTVARLRFPRLRVVYTFSPPFRSLTPQEDAEIADATRRSGVRVLFVGLGCPKQEQWLAAHRGRIPAVMLGVGAAFDFLAGAKPQAPRWTMSLGLEWLYRLATEPRRLWWRYFYHNPRFVALLALQLAGLLRLAPRPGRAEAR
jgi:N-acetylglucosaminyldiphosphoundecaprenol N-acetyl-beta-D-mannosaminyltransferase